MSLSVCEEFWGCSLGWEVRICEWQFYIEGECVCVCVGDVIGGVGVFYGV